MSESERERPITIRDLQRAARRARYYVSVGVAPKWLARDLDELWRAALAARELVVVYLSAAYQQVAPPSCVKVLLAGLVAIQPEAAIPLRRYQGFGPAVLLDGQGWLALSPNDHSYDLWPRLQAALDRLASKLGSDYVLNPGRAVPPTPVGEYRPKGTDEVAPQSADPGDGNLHGGDGASGEVEAGKPTGFPEGNNDGTVTNNVLSPAGGEGSVDGDTGVEPGRLCSVAGREIAPEEGGKQPVSDQAGRRQDSMQESLAVGGELSDPAAENSITTESPTGTAGATAQADATLFENPGGADAPPAVAYRSLRSGRASSQSKRQHGGVNARLADYKVDPKLVARCRRSLRRLVDDGATDTGPRWDWPEFAERLLVRRPLARARREEQGRPAILLLVDMSGSCTGITNKSFPVAKAAGALGVPGADVIVVAHSNGIPFEVQVNDTPAAPVHVPANDWRAVDAATPGVYESLLSRYDLRVVIAIGDADAAWVFGLLADRPRVKRFIWIDNYGGITPPERIIARHATGWGWSAAAKKKTVYKTGQRTVEDFLTAIERATG